MGRGNQPPKPRTWVIEAGPEGYLSEEEIARVIGEASVVVDRVGGVVQIAARREELPKEIYGVEGIYATTGLVCRWESYAPAARREEPPAPAPPPEPAPPVEREPEPAAVAAG